MKKMFSGVLRAMALVVLTTPLTVAASQWPSQPIRIVVPFAPGGSMDIMAREIAAGLSDVLPTKVYVENKPGAGGAIGALTIARAPADGHHLLIGNLGTQVTNPLMMKSVEYDPAKDFRPVRYVQQQPLFLTVASSFPASSVQELIDLVKSRNKPLLVGAPGNAHRVGIAQFGAGADIEVSPIPYGGPAPALSDLLGGHIEAIFDTGMAVVPLQQQGTVRLLGIGSAIRSPALPNIPTVAEQGLPGFEMIGINAIYAPSGTPDDIVDRLSAEIEKIVNTDNVQKRIADSGGISMNLGPAELAAWQTRTTEIYRKIISENNLTLD